MNDGTEFLPQLDHLECRLKLPLFDWERIGIEAQIKKIKSKRNYQRSKEVEQSVSLEAKIRHTEITGR